MDKCTYHDELITQILDLRRDISCLKTTIIKILVTGMSAVTAVVGLGVLC